MRRPFRGALEALAIVIGLCAAAAAQEGMKPGQGESPRDIYRKAVEDLQAGKLDEACAGLKKIVEMFPDAAEPRYNYACALSRKGDAKAAFAELEKAIDLGFDDAEHMAQDPDLETLRNDEKAWKDLIARKLGPKPAPELPLTDLDGKPASLADFKGSVVILDFWATWCGWCKKEIPHFNELQKEWGERGLKIVGVSDEAKDLQAPFAAEQKIAYTLLRGPETVPAAWGVEGYPTTFVLDREGRIVRKFVGYRERAVFEKVLAELIGVEKDEPKGDGEPGGEPKPRGKEF